MSMINRLPDQYQSGFLDKTPELIRVLNSRIRKTETVLTVFADMSTDTF